MQKLSQARAVVRIEKKMGALSSRLLFFYKTRFACVLKSRLCASEKQMADVSIFTVGSSVVGAAPLSAEEEGRIRSIPGLTMALVHPNHAMDGAYPSGVVYYLREDAKLPQGLVRTAIGGRIALYQMSAPVADKTAQRAIAALKHSKPSASGYDLDLNMLNVAEKREGAPWTAQFDSARHDAALVRGENDSGPDDQFFLLRTDAGHAGKQLEERASTMTAGALYTSALYRHTLLRASATNADRLAYASIADDMQSRPKLFSQDLLAHVDKDANEAHPDCAEAVIVAEYDVLRRQSIRTAQTQQPVSVIAYYRGCLAPSTHINTALHMGDPLNGATLYQTADGSPLLSNTLPLGSERVSVEQARAQMHTLKLDDRRLAHVRQTFEWCGKDSKAVGAELPECLYTHKWITNAERTAQAAALSTRQGRANAVVAVPLRPVCMHVAAVRP